MAKEMDSMLSSLDPALLHPSDAVRVLEAANAVELRAASIKTLVAGRAAEAAAWADDDGTYRYEGSATAAVGARLEAALDNEADRVFKAARAEGGDEPLAAYRADALANLICGGGAKVDTHVVVRVDESRLRGEG